MSSVHKRRDLPLYSEATLSKQFHRHLDAEIAVNDAQLQEAHQLRYGVYCESRGYEDPSRFPDGLEKDEYDRHSVHALVRHKLSGMAAGVVRLVLPDYSNLENCFPIERFCGHSFDNTVLDQFEFSRDSIAEVSRFAVSNDFISQVGSGRSANMTNATSGQVRILDDPSQYFPHISLGLIAMLFVASAKHRITHWYAVMEPSLSRLLSRSGIEFTPIGPTVNYHGKRQPMIANVNDLLSNIYQTRHEFFELIEGLGGIPVTFSARTLAGNHGAVRFG